MTSVAAWTLTACGGALVGIGGFFVIFRPPLLAEDARFMGSTSELILTAIPELTAWLRLVFWVLGGYIASTGGLVVYIANTGLRAGDVGALGALAVAGATSIGWMTAVNFMLTSHFRWALLALSGVWASGLLIAVAAR